MNQDLVVPEKSTNVRVLVSPAGWPVKAIRTGFRVLSPTLPSLAARWAEDLFFSPRRPFRPAWELEVLGRGERMSIARGDKPPLAAWRWGAEGPHTKTVLLVHGWQGRGAQLGTFVEPLVDAGFSVVAFDAPAHGDTGGKRASPMHIAAAIERVLAEIGDVHAIVAHSMGALATSIVMAKAQRASKLVYVAPSIGPARYEETFARVLGLGDDVRGRMRKIIEERYSVKMTDLEATRLAARIQAPLLVVHDRDDDDVPVEDGKALVAAWGEAELMETRGLGHRRVLKDEDVIARVVRFVRRVEALGRA